MFVNHNNVKRQKNKKCLDKGRVGCYNTRILIKKGFDEEGAGNILPRETVVGASCLKELCVCSFRAGRKKACRMAGE